jgi:hypothetical protein
MFNLHKPDSFGNTAWFIFVVFVWATGFYRAKRAGAGTYIAQNHKRCSASTPTFTHIRARPTLTNGMKFKVVHNAAHIAVIFAHRQANFQPLRAFGPAFSGRIFEDGKFEHEKLFPLTKLQI